MDTLDMALACLPERRPQQERYARAVANAMAQGVHLVSEAPVGTGKSFGYLLAALHVGKRTLITTNSITLQEQLRVGDLPFVAELAKKLNRPWSWAILKGANNYLCHHKADGTPNEELRAWAFDQGQNSPYDLDTLPPGTATAVEIDDVRTNLDECLKRDCTFFGDCGFRAARRGAEKAQVVVTNHAMLMILAKGAPVLDLNSFGAVVIDEGHQLPKSARGSFSTLITRHKLSRAFTMLRKLTKDAELALRFWEKAMGVWDNLTAAALAQRTDKGRLNDGDRWALDHRELLPIADDLMALLNRASEAIEEGALWIDNDRAREGMWTTLSDLTSDLGALRRPGDSVVVWEVKGANDPKPSGKIEVCPVDVGPILDRAFWRNLDPRPCTVCEATGTMRQDGDDVPCTYCEATGKVAPKAKLPYILTSATLAVGAGGGPSSLDFGPFMDEAGLPDTDNVQAMAVGSPFDYARQAAIYVAAVDDPTKRGQDPTAFLREVDYLVNVSGGRALILCTSHRGMRQAFEGRGHGYPSRMQDGRSERMALVNWLRTTPGAVLYATMGFWEGVSVEGDALGLVVIDKIPYPVPTDPVYAARKEALGRAAFGRLAVPEAATHLRQGAGRLIRTMSDRGLVAIMDGRIYSQAAIRDQALYQLMPGAPIFLVTQRKDMVQAWANTGAPIDVKASGYELAPPPKVTPPPAPAKPTPAAKPAKPIPEWAHPVLHLLAPQPGALVHGLTVRQAGELIKPLLPRF